MEAEAVAVVTVRRAATDLGTNRHALGLMLMRRELTAATVNGKPAVLVDEAYRRAQRKARKAAA